MHLPGKRINSVGEDVLSDSGRGTVGFAFLVQGLVSSNPSRSTGAVRGSAQDPTGAFPLQLP